MFVKIIPFNQVVDAFTDLNETKKTIITQLVGIPIPTVFI